MASESDVWLQVMPASYVIAARLEQGRNVDAAVAAADFLRRAPAFQQDAFGDDWSMFFENVLALGGKLAPDELEAHRTAWIDQQFDKNPRPERLLSLWRDAWGEWARDPAQAALAMKALARWKDRGLTVPSTSQLEPGLALALGQAHLLTGDLAKATDFLEQAANSCFDLIEPYRSTRSYLMLADAKRRNGDVAGAKDAYQAVINRWGGSADTSITLQAAQAGIAALPTTTTTTP